MTKFAFAAPAVAALLLAAPASADEFLDSLELAREAYEAGDLAGAKEEMDYASQILAQTRMQSLSALLPDAMEGWTRRDDDGGGGGFGGGLTAAANYLRANERVTIQVSVDSPMIATMAMMMGNAAAMAAQGEVKRIGRQKVIVTNRGEIQTVVDNHILIQITGNAPEDVKEAYFEAIDMRALKNF